MSKRNGERGSARAVLLIVLLVVFLAVVGAVFHVLGGILSLPLRLLGWILHLIWEHWLVCGIAALVGWLILHKRNSPVSGS